MVFIGVRLAFGIRGYALINVVLVAMWLAVVVGIVREDKKLVSAEAVKHAA